MLAYPLASQPPSLLGKRRRDGVADAWPNSHHLHNHNQLNLNNNNINNNNNNSGVTLAMMNDMRSMSPCSFSSASSSLGFVAGSGAHHTASAHGRRRMLAPFASALMMSHASPSSVSAASTSTSAALVSSGCVSLPSTSSFGSDKPFPLHHQLYSPQQHQQQQHQHQQQQQQHEESAVASSNNDHDEYPEHNNNNEEQPTSIWDDALFDAASCLVEFKHSSTASASSSTSAYPHVQVFQPSSAASSDDDGRLNTTERKVHNQHQEQAEAEAEADTEAEAEHNDQDAVMITDEQGAETDGDDMPPLLARTLVVADGPVPALVLAFSPSTPASPAAHHSSSNLAARSPARTTSPSAVSPSSPHTDLCVAVEPSSSSSSAAVGGARTSSTGTTGTNASSAYSIFVTPPSRNTSPMPARVLTPTAGAMMVARSMTPPSSSSSSVSSSYADESDDENRAAKRAKVIDQIAVPALVLRSLVPTPAVSVGVALPSRVVSPALLMAAAYAH